MALNEFLPEIRNLAQLLDRASKGSGGITFYTSVDKALKPWYISYADLREDALRKAHILRRVDGLSASSILLLHFDTQREVIEWFWAAVLAGFLPAISTPFVHDIMQRKKHLRHLQTVLNEPLILTTESLVSEFLDMEGLRLCPVESLTSMCLDPVCLGDIFPMAGETKQPEDTAVLMFTSGSTGNAKVVPLLHRQILLSVQGKSAHHHTNAGDVFLNWVGLDHVASLCEIHLNAVSLGSHQVHVPASELLHDPLHFIHLLDTHRVTYTFAPNFFLNRLLESLVSNPHITADLSCLRRIISGGEANVVATCDALTRQLRRFGIRGEVISPGFGMTETCAGSIYALENLSRDLERGVEFASLGTCIPGIQMRVMQLGGNGEEAACGETGELQLTGPVVFNGYFNNPAATNQVFTEDRWFVTGDLAWIDDSGALNLAGRTTDTIIVNGVKWSATGIETAIEEEGITGVMPSFTVAFSCRAAGSPTEDIGLVYSPAYGADDVAARFETFSAITKTVSLLTGRKPAHSIPLPTHMMEKSALGKISREKVRKAFETGDYAAFKEQDMGLIRLYKQSIWRGPETETEARIQRILAELLGILEDDISVDISIFELGITSFNLILLKAMIQDAVEAPMEIPMSVLLIEPTLRAIASAVDGLMSQSPAYNPIVPLQPHGSKTPLFFIHPGSGDILVFIALAAYFPTRPIYALRTRGYNPNDSLFHSMQETTDTYVDNIRQIQPEGPYAIAGYSLGSTLAFEVAKKLEAQGQEVRFLASIDYPPHIAQYVRGLNWFDVLLHISFFLELIDEQTLTSATTHVHKHKMSRPDALAYVFSIGDPDRVHALVLTPDRLERIADIGENFRVHAEVYEPLGSVDHLDVFVADPPRYAARDRQDWRDNKLGRWADFVRSDIQFHDCPGIHAKMLNPGYISGFVKQFKAALKRRGV